MTPAETLRAAARLMRERAQAATPGPWIVAGLHRQGVASTAHHGGTTGVVGLGYTQEIDATHIASWHPAVALAVADWLDEEAAWTGQGDDKHALAVARAYLGEAS